MRSDLRRLSHYTQRLDILCMNRFRPLAVSVAALLPLFSPLLAPPAASAQTWNGGNGTWGTAGNWSSNTVPNSSSAEVVFPSSGPGLVVVYLEGASYTVNKLTFIGDADGKEKIFDGTIILAGGGATVNVGPGGGDRETVRMDTGSSLQLNTAVTFNTSDATSVIFVHAGTITGAGSLVKTGAGSMIIDTASTYSGDTQLNGGTITIRNGAALSTGNVTFGAGSTGTLRGDGNITVTNPALMLDTGATGTFSAADGTSLTLQPANGITVGNNANLVFGRAGDTGTVVLGGRLTGYSPTGTLSVTAGTLRAEAGVRTLGMLTEGLASTTVAAGATLDFNDAGTPADENRIRIRNLQGAGRVHTGSDVSTKLSLSSANFSGAITGAGAVLVHGDVTLSGASTYSGGTRLNSGQLRVGRSNALGSGTLEINGGTLILNDGTYLANNVSVRGDFALAGNGEAGGISGNIDLGDATRTITLPGEVQDIIYASFSGVISGSGGLTIMGTPNALPAPSMLFLDGANGNTYTGLTTVGAFGRLNLAKQNGFAIPGGVLVESNGRLAINGPENQQIQGTLTLASGGYAQIRSSQTIDDLQGSGMMEILGSNHGMDLTIRAGSFTGTIVQSPPGNEPGARLIKDGPGTFTFTGYSNHAAGTIVRGGGTLAINSDMALGDVAGGLQLQDGRLQYLASFDTARTIELSGTGGIDTGIYSSTLSGRISGGGTLVKAGEGTLRLAVSNTYTGGTVLSEGRLEVGNFNALGTGLLTIQGGTLQLDGALRIANDVSVQGDFTLAGEGSRTSTITGNIHLGGASRTITMGSDLDAIHADLSGVISGSGGVAISNPTGGSIMTIGGDSGNTFSGLLTINSLANVHLAKTNGFAAPAGAVVHQFGRLSLFSDNQQIQGTVTIETGGTLLIDRLQTIDHLQGDGLIYFNANVTSALTVLEGAFSGDIREVGSTPAALIKDGPGRLTLTGHAYHTGGTFVRGFGTLAVDSARALGDPNSELSLENGTLELLASFNSTQGVVVTGFGGIDTGDHSSTFSGVISGAGLLAKRGNGTLRLSGVNTHSGGTSIEGGVLEIFSDANLGAEGSDMRFHGGTLRLLGPLFSTRSGGINGGGATIDTNGFDAILTSQFSGEGAGLRKVGAGKLTLAGESNFSGGTYVENGTLILNGSVANDVFLGQMPRRGPQRPLMASAEAARPVFGGTGRVGGDLYNFGGIVAPGNSPGTLTVDGSFTQSASGTLQIEIAGRNSSQFDRLLIGRQANLDGVVQFISLDGFKPRRGDQFVFLTAAGGINGTFSTVELDAPLIAGRVAYTATTASLSFARRPIAPIFNGGGKDDEIISPANQQAPLPRLTANQTSVAHVLDDAINDRRLDRVFGELDRYSLPGIPGALDLIAPEELSAIYEIGIGSARVQAFNLDRHLSDLRAGRTGFSGDRFRLPGIAENAGKTVLTPDGKTTTSGKDVFTPGPDNRWSVFLSGSGEFLDIEGDGNARGYDITTSGFTLGADYRVCEGFAIGVLAGYSGTGTELAGDGHILVNSGKLGVYATGFNENWYVNALAAGGYNSYDIKRRGLGGTTRGDTDGGEFTGFLSGGYDMHTGPFTFGPFVEAQYTYVGYAGFEERGSAAPLEIQSNDSSSLQTRAGVRLAYQHQAGSIGIRPELRVGWQHEYLDRTRPTDSRFSNGAGGVFRVEGPEIGRDSLIVNASVSFSFSDRFSTYVAYDGELGRQRYESHTVSGGVGIGF